MKNPPETKKEKTPELVEGIDYYFENDLMVLTARFLLKRGFCCRNNCRNCPYREERANKPRE